LNVKEKAMNSKRLSTTRRSPIAPYESLVWFALWNIAREQRLNFDALAAYSQRMLGVYLHVMHSQSARRR
jgi:hypothetical protein